MGERDSNRAAFPATARIIDELREVFGPDVKLVWAEENGREIGQRELPGTAVAMTDIVLTRPDTPAREMKGRR